MQVNLYKFQLNALTCPLLKLFESGLLRTVNVAGSLLNGRPVHDNVPDTDLNSPLPDHPDNAPRSRHYDESDKSYPQTPALAPLRFHQSVHCHFMTYSDIFLICQKIIDIFNWHQFHTTIGLCRNLLAADIDFFHIFFCFSWLI